MTSTQGKVLHFLIAAGGTGGHLFPAMAVVERLRELSPLPCEFHFVGTARRIEARAVPEAGYDFHPMPITGVSKIASMKTLLLPWRIARSLAVCRGLIKRYAIDAVLCTGAYLSYPAGLAASQLSVPLFLMQSDANPGKTIRMLSNRAERLFVSFEESRSYYGPDMQGQIVYSGNPVRKAFSSHPTAQEARQKFGLAPDRPTLFCFGGSLGARSINSVIEQALPLLADQDIQILWQTGEHYQPTTVSDAGMQITVRPFIKDMPAAYAAADLVLCRSGATTVAELSLLGKPAILVPLPTAANDEQSVNARLLQERGAALLLPDADLNPADLAETIRSLLSSPASLQSMAANANGLAQPEAATQVAEHILDLLHAGPTGVLDERH